MKTNTLLLCLAIVVMSTACDRRDEPAEDTSAATADTASPAADAAATTGDAMGDAAGTAGANASDATADAAGATDANPPGATAGAGAPAADDSLALGLLGAVNEHEIAAAKQAKEKDVSAPVMEFAEMMETQHSDNQAKVKSLGTPASAPEVQAMKEKGQAELDTLGKKSGKEYETAYADAMVKGHTDALSLIDTRLITLASSEPVKNHLTQTRDAVAKHLEEAKELQANVGKAD